MKDILGLINIQEKNTLIRDLANDRPVELIPFGGRYRLIDFAMSSMVNSGIRNVGIMLPENSRSVLDHIRSGKDWGLARHHEGLTYLPPAKIETSRYGGDLKNFYYNLDFIEHNHKSYVLIADGNFLYNIDFRDLLDFHQETRADITLPYVKNDIECLNGVVLSNDDSGKVSDIAFKRIVNRDEKLHLGIGLMSRSIFIDIVRNAFDRGGTDFLFDSVVKSLSAYRIMAMEHKGYACEINSIESYYRASMDLFDLSHFNDLFRHGNFIATKAKDKSPVRYSDSAVIKNSLIANGCDIEGEVENCILFRGVRVEKGARIKDSIIMQNTHIQKNVLGEYIICDKNVVISGGKWLRGAPNYPLIVGKNTTI